MTPEELQEYHEEIRNCRVVEGVSVEELREMAPHVRIESFSQNDEILEEGNYYRGLWLILRGKCCVVKCCSTYESVLATLEQGSVFGEMSFYDSAPHSATVRADADSICLCLTYEGYEKLRDCCPSASEKISINLVKLLSDRLRRMDDWTCDLVNSEEKSQRHQEWHEFRSRLYSDLFD